MRREYVGELIAVSFDAERCIHVAECLRGAPDVFNLLRRPWVLPDAVDPVALAEVVERCPSGALQYRWLSDSPDAVPESGLRVTVVPSGPLLVRGAVRLVTGDGAPFSEDSRVALCRCGASQRKPFCDNSHMDLRRD